ncbi:MAG: ComEC/Rec2 family competence protein [Ketobacteraceae bacterium]|nr:ComEC/Rec2 family competence protein [Ketobacteraceae bacterium]
MLKLLLASLLGIGIAVREAVIPPGAVLGLYWALWALAAVVFKGLGSWSRFRPVWVLLAVGLAAYSWTLWRGSLYLEVRAQLVTSDLWLVDVKEAPEKTRGEWRTRLVLVCPAEQASVGRCARGHSDYLLEYKVLARFGSELTHGAGPALPPGRRLLVRMEARPWSWRGNPGFDEPAWALSNNLVARVRLLEVLATVPGPTDRIVWRDELSRALKQESPVERSAFSGVSLAPVAQALTLGNRSEMTDDHWQLFRETGTSHLMAISGMHLGIISGWIYWIVLALFRRITTVHAFLYPPVPAAIAAVSIGFLYSWMSGFSLPTQRAFLMLLFGVLGAFTGRPRMVWNGLCLALLLILIWQPFAVLAMGLWLSFAAVAVVFLVIADRVMVLSGKRNLTDALGALLRLQGVIFVFMLPLSLYFFHGVSLNSVPANLVAIPFVTIALLPLCLLQVLCVLVTGAAAGPLTEVIYWLIDSLLLFLVWLRDYWPGYFEGSLSGTELALMLIFAFFTCVPAGMLARFCSGAGFVLMLTGATAYPDGRVVLLAHKAPFALLYADGGVVSVDETPGLSFHEARLLQAMIPELVQAHDHDDWFGRWKGAPWQIHYQNTQGGSLAVMDVCHSARIDDNGQAHAIGTSGILTRIFHLPPQGTGGACVLSVEWRGQHWLWLPRLTPSQQLALLNDKTFQSLRFDVVMGSTDAYLGALYNRLQNAIFFFWRAGEQAHGELGIYNNSLSARSITAYNLAETGALVFTGDTVSGVQPLMPRRFYHPPAPHEGL